MINDYSYNHFDFSFDVYPKVVTVGKEAVITVEAKEAQEAFEGEYTVQVFPMNEGSLWAYGERDNNIFLKVNAEAGALKINYVFASEAEYFISLSKDGKGVKSFSVYAVEGDLVGRYPYIGDLHVHSNYSDGRQSVEEVVVNYRRNGYDFFALTDHHRYYSSLKAIEFGEKCKTDMAIFPGEEVHLNVTDVHTVNFGGKWSVNALLKTNPQCVETGIIPEGSYTSEELMEEVMELAETLDVPLGVEKKDVAACKWIYDKIRESGGIAIYPHPFWKKPEYHVPVTLNDYILERGDFDAFELLGGEVYFEMNGLQVIKYYEMKEKGIDFPVVGSSDSHNVTGNERYALIAKTLVLSPSLDFEDIKKSILSKEHYSIPVDARPLDFGVVAPFRFATYASFLLRCFFPVHDKLCAEEGEAIRKCINGTEEDFENCRKLSGTAAKLYEKYFSFS